MNRSTKDISLVKSMEFYENRQIKREAALLPFYFTFFV